MNMSVLVLYWNIFIVFIVYNRYFDGVHAQQVSFSCKGRTSGYYADVPAGCQIYHLCDSLGRQFTYRCPKNTLFQQRMLICDHWYFVNCSESERDYNINLLIGQRGKAFIQDDELQQINRNPPPDFIDLTTPKNQLVPTEESTTQRYSSTSAPALVKQIFYKTNYNNRNRTNQLATNALYRKRNDEFAINNGQNSLNQAVNFPSNYQGTTPVYPPHVDLDPLKFSEYDIPSSSNNNEQQITSDVNFASNFQGTTPVYPHQVPEVFQTKFQDLDQQPPAPVFVNFPSNFKGTTPVYPNEVNLDMSKFFEENEPPEFRKR